MFLGYIGMTIVINVIFRGEPNEVYPVEYMVTVSNNFLSKSDIFNHYPTWDDIKELINRITP